MEFNNFKKGAGMKKILIMIIFTLILNACYNTEPKKWVYSLNYIGEKKENLEIITYPNQKIISKTGILSFHNKNNFNVVVYLFSKNKKEKIEIPPRGIAVFSKVKKDIYYTLGCYAAVKEGEIIKLIVYEGEYVVF